VTVACPPLIAVVPSIVPVPTTPSQNVTLPAGGGVPAEGPTNAVNVTVCPADEGFTEEARAVAERLTFAWTVCVTKLDELVAKFALPEYTAVMGWDPAVSVNVLNTACPVPGLIAIVASNVPTLTPLSQNKTFPDAGVNVAVSVTVAVNVTAWPTDEGFSVEVRFVDVAKEFSVTGNATLIATP
jgi:hypothetical protein